MTGPGRVRVLSMVAALALSACALPATDQAEPAPEPMTNPQSAKERFVRAVEREGCVVNERNSASILAGATLSVEELGRIMSELRAEGRGDIAANGQAFRITTGACA